MHITSHRLVRHARYGLGGLALAALLATGGCSWSTSRNISDEGLPEEVLFPNLSDEYQAKEAITPNRENLSKMRPGLGKRDVYYLLGAPHRHEAFGAGEWDYVFKFPQPKGVDQYCQYKVVYDRHRFAQNFYWKPDSCYAYGGGADRNSGVPGATMGGGK